MFKEKASCNEKKTTFQGEGLETPAQVQQWTIHQVGDGYAASESAATRHLEKIKYSRSSSNVLFNVALLSLW